MRLFAKLYSELDETTKTNEKVEALTRYFMTAPAADAAWAIYFLVGRKPRQVVSSTKLRTWAAEEAGISEWLFQESYDAVGDLAETIALLLPEPVESRNTPLHVWIEEHLLPLRNQDETTQRSAMIEAWRSMDGTERFVWNKLISGGFRVGVSQQLVTRALGKVRGIDEKVIAHRLMGDWEPSLEFFEQLHQPDATDADVSRPYPFFLAYALEDPLETLGAFEDWQAEWKWDGIRSQLIRRLGQTFLWSRGEELVTERYPELAELGDTLPDGTVIDGEILPWKENTPLPFAQLQRRIGRKTIGKKLLADVPVILMAYDLLETDGRDARMIPLEGRRTLLAELIAETPFPERFHLSPLVAASSWNELSEARQNSRALAAEGVMIKRKESHYGVGRRRGDWWKWKVDPLTIDAILIAAQRGHGKRASLYTDYTFGVWNEGQLVTIAKAYSGLTDAEIREVDAFIRTHMVEKFGPVRTVQPLLVFELAFEGINLSSRHKSGVAVRFPRILRQRTDKKPEDADTLEQVRALLAKNRS